MRETGGHPSKRTYQAIRIALNRELDVLRDSLDDMIKILNPGGRICIITFHSLEDRIVKLWLHQPQEKNRDPQNNCIFCNTIISVYCRICNNKIPPECFNDRSYFGHAACQ